MTLHPHRSGVKPPVNFSRKLAGTASEAVPDDLAELKGILVGPELLEIKRLKKRLDDPSLFANDVSRALPEAISLGLQKNENLSSVLFPLVEDGVRLAIKKDINSFADILFPVMGPAIRKAVADSIQRMIQSLNEVLERTCSFQGLKWRMEAFRTSRPLAEIVLLHSLVYRVEQVFLVHRETGILLQSASVEPGVVEDQDIVSGMLAAIRDFVHDSFRVEKDDSLKRFTVGDLSVWIEQGPLALLACVIRGNGPESLGEIIQETLELIHLEQRAELESFAGDISVFEAVRPKLETCLQEQRGERKKKSFLIWLFLFLILGVPGLWATFRVRDNHRWRDYFESLNDQPGIIISEVKKAGGKFVLTGLRDPLAMDPRVLLEKAGLEPSRLENRLELFHAMKTDFILPRAINILKPPPSVSLRLSGTSLIAQGAADHKWIMETRQTARAVPGVSEYFDGGLEDLDLKSLDQIKAEIESSVILFKAGATDVNPDFDVLSSPLISSVKKLDNLSHLAGVDFHLLITGHSDSSGREGENLSLSRERAESIRKVLISNGIFPSKLTAVGVGSGSPVKQELEAADKEMNRSATFKVLFKNNAFAGSAGKAEEQ